MSDDSAADLEQLKDDDPLSLEQAARILLRGLVSASTLRAAAGRGELTYERIGRRLVVTPAAIRAWRERCRVPAREPARDAPADNTEPYVHPAIAERLAKGQTAAEALMSKLGPSPK